MCVQGALRKALVDQSLERKREAVDAGEADEDESEAFMYIGERGGRALYGC